MYALLAAVCVMASVALFDTVPGSLRRRMVKDANSSASNGIDSSHGVNDCCGANSCHGVGDCYGADDRRGISSVIAAMRASLRSGSTLLEAVKQQNGHSFATPRLTRRRLVMMLQKHRIRAETDEQIEHVADSLHVVSIVSESLGCEVVRCLDVVADDYRRMRMLEDLKNNAFAVPEATVRLLSALPAATVALGELLGASPVAFLLGSDVGLLCLTFGLLCYAAGLRWVHILLDDMRAHGEQTGTVHAGGRSANKGKK